MRSTIVSVLTLIHLVFIPAAYSQAPSQNAEVADIQRKLDVLAAEVEKLRSGEPPVEVTETKAPGTGARPISCVGLSKTEGFLFRRLRRGAV